MKTPLNLGKFLAISLAAWAGLGTAAAATRYVSAAGSNTPPYTDWSTAALTIQDAVDVAGAGDNVLVADGVYASGTTVTPGHSSVNRVVITKDILVESVNGPDSTVIEGGTQVRCVYMSAGELSGFTVTKGETLGPPNRYDSTGAGVNMRDGGTVSNCHIVGNHARNEGGGTYRGTVNNCTIERNTSLGGGGGVSGGTVNNSGIIDNRTTSDFEAFGGGAFEANLNNCLVRGNSSLFGGGVSSVTANNCTIVGNSGQQGGGAIDGQLNNCTVTGNTATVSGGGLQNLYASNSIVWDNEAGVAGDNYIYAESMHYCCTFPDPGGTGNISVDPLLTAEGRLLPGSPCIDAGAATAPSPNSVPASDRDGEARWDSPAHPNAVSTVDIGADEYVDREGDGIPDYWEEQNGLDPNADDSSENPDGDEGDNTFEYLADTDPFDPDSALRIVAVESGPGGVSIEWHGGTWSRQILEWSPDLDLWHPLLTIEPPVTTAEHLDPSGDTERYYRVRAER